MPAWRNLRPESLADAGPQYHFGPDSRPAAPVPSEPGPLRRANNVLQFLAQAHANVQAIHRLTLSMDDVNAPDGVGIKPIEFESGASIDALLERADELAALLVSDTAMIIQRITQ